MTETPSERILCVMREDEHDEELIEALEYASHYEIVSVFSFEDAIEEIANGDYTLLITEFDLLDMSAIDVLAAVNSLRPKISSIVIDDSLNPQHAIRAFRLGAIDYMYRPVNLDFLLIRIGQELLQRKKRTAQPERAEKPIAPVRNNARDQRLDPTKRAAAFVLRRAHFVQINELLKDLKDHIGASFAGLLDADHNVISAVGELGSSDLMTLKQVFASDLGGIRKLTNVLDEKNFSHTFLTGESTSVFISEFGEAHPVSMVVITPADSKPGMVVLWAKRAANEVGEIIKNAIQMAKRSTETIEANKSRLL